MERLNSIFERTCWVCFATEEDEPGLEWTSPCKCSGATKWVHQVCLQQWVDEKQRGSSSVKVCCPQCQYSYHIVYPSSSIILYVYESTNRAITFCSPMTLAGLTASSLYWVSFTYGVTAASFALGRERSIEFFTNPESAVAVLALPLLPWAILGLKLLRIEVLVIKAWYRIVSPLIHALANKIPIGNSFSQENQVRFVPAPVSLFPFLSRSIIATFFLPFISSSIGWALSYALKSTSTLKRTLIIIGTLWAMHVASNFVLGKVMRLAHEANLFRQGGASYLLLTYATKIYLQHVRGQQVRQRGT